MRNQRFSAGASPASVNPPPVVSRSRKQAAPPAADAPRHNGPLNLPMGTSSGQLESASHEEVIRRRAYERYERNGCVSGRDLEDWLAAEAEVGAQLMVGRVGED